MRLLFITPGYYPRIGGVEYVVKSVAERLAKAGHNVTVLAGEPGINKPFEEEVKRVRVVRWPIWSPGNAYHFPRRRSELEKLLKDLARNCDVVHVHSVHSILSIYSLNIVKDLSVKIVVTPHYHGTGHTALRKLLWIPWRLVVAKALSEAHVIHAVSAREASLIAEHYPYVKEKIAVISNGVDEDVYGYRWIGRDSDYVVYAGRIEKYKRLELAVDVAKEMGLRLLVIGRGSYRGKLMKYAQKVYREGVEFLEPQPREKYLELLSKARYAINPSRHEAFSIFVAEALAVGVPAIVSREIAENLEAQAKPFNNNLILADKASIKTWNEIIYRYLTIYTRKNP
jgi:Glycosyltransferase